MFLKEYDKKKVERGVFYTPQPVVSYIIRSVHELLQKEFGLEDGLASTITWGELVKKFAGKTSTPSFPLVGNLTAGNDKDSGLSGMTEFSIPEGVSPDEHFVQMLDPASSLFDDKIQSPVCIFSPSSSKINSHVSKL